MLEAENDHKQKQEQQENDRKLLAQGALSENAVQRSAMEAVNSMARLGKSRATAIMKSREHIETEFAAPTDVVLVEKLVNEYAYVNKGDTIASVMNADTVEVEVFPSVEQFEALSVGDQLTVWDPARHVKLPGTVVFIAPKLDTTTRTFRVNIEIENIKESTALDVRQRYHLIPGTLVEVTR